jgi:hypothetical protein
MNEFILPFPDLHKLSFALNILLRRCISKRKLIHHPIACGNRTLLPTLVRNGWAILMSFIQLLELIASQ